ncbi:hypothetical protein CSUI_006979 [Cystoisospora suis]|uniref:Uncharacterized protein n=1 Tax=Cystoisospora suis TaxID=483139 RepID=A0A2C6KSJ2_9APIC|nr:hypothetical protein CSUI_006979 [Cystoisospora suis]
MDRARSAMLLRCHGAPGQELRTALLPTESEARLNCHRDASGRGTRDPPQE